jgi:hypothetical protein
MCTHSVLALELGLAVFLDFDYNCQDFFEVAQEKLLNHAQEFTMSGVSVFV